MIGLTVIAKVTAKKGKEAELEREWRAVADETKREQGCLQYDLLRGTEDGREFVSVERWSSKDDLESHLKSPHVQNLLKLVPSLAERAPEIKVYRDTLATA